MSISAIRKRYDVPAKRGGAVRYTGDPGIAHDGTIVGSQGTYLRIRMPTWPGGCRIVTCHPTWKLEYLPEAQSSNHQATIKQLSTTSRGPS